MDASLSAAVHTLLEMSSLHIISVSPARTALTHDSSAFRGVAAYSGAAFSSLAASELPHPEMTAASNKRRHENRSNAASL